MTSDNRIAKPIVLHIITGLNDGGAESVLYNLVCSADEFEHKVISLMGRGKYGPLLEAAGVEVNYLELRPSFPSPLKLFSLIGLIRSSAPDVVQCWMYHADLLGGYAAWLAGVRSIVWGLHHTTLDKRGTKWTTRQLVKLNKKVSSWLPSKIITCSKKGAIVHQEIGYPDEKMVVVHNGYNTADFTPNTLERAKVRKEFNISDEQFLLGCVARYNPQKDHKNLINGFSGILDTHSSAHLLLVGPGLTQANLEVTRLISRLGLEDHITLVGPRDDIPAIMNGLDLHVLGSAFGEAFPNVLSEAMACGTPCVATNVGDSSTIIGDTGKIVPPRSSAALTNAILEIAPRLFDQKFQDACRRRIVGKFTLTHMVDGYQRVWLESMIGLRGKNKQPVKLR